MADDRKALGQWGEHYAAAYLQQLGYQLITSGWRCRWGEIDLIAYDQTTLVIIEVRTRRGAAHGSAAESLTLKKRQRLAQLMQAYLQVLEQAQTPWLGEYRIDAIAITLSRGQPQLEHFQAISIE
ncbi:YraN family protein [Herpetosiphon geysericola]|uniref:UPF0102 protein SE18_22705 n=1 Tax=Herpetosiphon geysericola TaxID=70996 RepID=A0A0P6Y7T0_9CHLR|nr:YraN family protein [Herpetosiphon geysericola]KPL81446.1 hypothetical protein SE18_22705 [Herpetosiphon geysericola]